MITSSAELRSVIGELGKHDPDPGVVAEKILAGLADAEAHVVAQVTLRDYVRHVLAKPVSTPVMQESARVPQGSASYRTKGGQKTASASTAALIDWYSAELAASVYVGESWKKLGDCNTNDLQYLIDSRRSKAADVLAEADRYERLLKAVKKARVDTVSSLDASVGREVLKR